MTKLLYSSIIFSIIISVQSGMIYRRYEKQHPKKNYIQVVEIFDTVQRPPQFIENEKSLNDFLARDAFKTDMNCTVATVTTTVKSTTSTQSSIVKTTKKPIQPNPKENKNPDYTELYNWPKPNIQVTKHLPKTIKPPLIVIKETDIQSTQNRTILDKTEGSNTINDIGHDFYDENTDYEEDENLESEEYNEDNYELVNEDNYENQLSDDENYDGIKRRRKRLNNRHGR